MNYLFSFIPETIWKRFAVIVVVVPKFLLGFTPSWFSRSQPARPLSGAGCACSTLRLPAPGLLRLISWARELGASFKCVSCTFPPWILGSIGSRFQELPGTRKVTQPECKTPGRLWKKAVWPNDGTSLQTEEWAQDSVCSWSPRYSASFHKSYSPASKTNCFPNYCSPKSPWFLPAVPQLLLGSIRSVSRLGPRSSCWPDCWMHSQLHLIKFNLLWSGHF